MTESRKDAAVTFLRLCSSGRVREAYDRYVAPNFRHHNPYFAGNADALAAGMADAARQFPDTTFEVQRVLEDGDLVAVHSHVRLLPGGAHVAVVHVCRFAGDRIIELWDIGQPVPETSPNDLGMF